MPKVVCVTLLALLICGCRGTVAVDKTITKAEVEAMIAKAVTSTVAEDSPRDLTDDVTRLQLDVRKLEDDGIDKRRGSAIVYLHETGLTPEPNCGFQLPCFIALRGTKEVYDGTELDLAIVNPNGVAFHEPTITIYKPNTDFAERMDNYNKYHEHDPSFPDPMDGICSWLHVGTTQKEFRILKDFEPGAETAFTVVWPGRLFDNSKVISIGVESHSISFRAARGRHH